MGVLTPTYSILLSQLKQDWQIYRRALPKHKRSFFDELFKIGNETVQAGNVQGNAFPTETLLLSVCMELLEQNQKLQERVEKLEAMRPPD